MRERERKREIEREKKRLRERERKKERLRERPKRWKKRSMYAISRPAHFLLMFVCMKFVFDAT